MSRSEIHLFAMLAVAMLAASSFPTSAQVKEGNNFEIGGGYNFASFKRSNDARCAVSGPGVFFEYRYATSFGIDVGGQINWKYAKGQDYTYIEIDPLYDITYNNVCLKALFDYNFLPERVVNPFVGIGTGGGMTFMRRTDNSNGLCFFTTIAPRVGVQIWRFRLTFDFDLMFTRKGLRYNIGSSTLSSRNSVFSSVIALNLGFSF